MRNLTPRINLLVLGASGGVANAFLGILPKYRSQFGLLILLDRDDKVTKSTCLNHKELDYIFIQSNLKKENVDNTLRELYEKYSISIVLDLTDYDTLPILSATDSLGLSYLNCSLNSEYSSMGHFVEDSNDFFKRFNKNIHVLSLGMNPGIIHHLIVKGVLEYGLPNEFIEIEYDSSIPKDKPKKPFITWSKKQFLNEAVWGPAGYCGDGGQYIETEEKAVNTLVDTKKFLAPIKKLRVYPQGMIVPHDEVITMSRILEIPGKFIYAIHPSSLSELVKVSNKKSFVKEEDIDYIDNISEPLLGSDCIGVWLKYVDKNICYFFDVQNSKIHGTNSTLFLVGVGVAAGLIDYIQNPLLENGVYSALELNNENFLKIVSEHVEIKKYEEKVK